MEAVTECLLPSASSFEQPQAVVTTKQNQKFAPSAHSNATVDERMLLNKQTSRNIWKATPELYARTLRELGNISMALNLAKRHIVPFRDIPCEPDVCLEDGGDANKVSLFGPLRAFIEDCSTAVSVALDEYKPRQISGESASKRFVFWVDASIRERKLGGVGISVVHKVARDSDDWITQGYIVNRRMTIFYAEALAIVQALHNASCMSDSLLEPGTTVVVYSDCKFFLRRTIAFDESNGEDAHFLVGTTRRKAEELRRRGISVELHWVPSHQHVPGNVLADKVARLASKKYKTKTLQRFQYTATRVETLQ